MLWCDQGNKLALSEAFRTTMQRKHGYVIKPTGTDDPAQNGGAELWNDTFAVMGAAVRGSVIGGLLVGGADSRSVLAQLLGALADQHDTT